MKRGKIIIKKSKRNKNKTNQKWFVLIWLGCNANIHKVLEAKWEWRGMNSTVLFFFFLSSSYVHMP